MQFARSRSVRFLNPNFSAAFLYFSGFYLFYDLLYPPGSIGSRGALRAATRARLEHRGDLCVTHDELRESRDLARTKTRISFAESKHHSASSSQVHLVRAFACSWIVNRQPDRNVQIVRVYKSLRKLLHLFMCLQSARTAIATMTLNAAVKCAVECSNAAVLFFELDAKSVVLKAKESS